MRLTSSLMLSLALYGFVALTPAPAAAFFFSDDTPEKKDEKKEEKAEEKTDAAKKNSAAEKPAEKTAEPAKEENKKETADKKPASGEEKPAEKVTATQAPAAKGAAAKATNDGDALPATDVDESKLPPYPEGAVIAMGEMKTYKTTEEDTFLDIARHFDLGYVELRAANPTVDPWAATPGTELVIPTFTLLPRAPQEGVVVNLGKMRLYHFKEAGAVPVAYAIGIGREGLNTPVGETTITRKVAGPQWYPTDRMRKEKPYLPAAVPAGPSNPLGTHALYLGWPTFLIHGSNKPWGIGRRVSSGCMRLYPEDIISFFNDIEPGTKITVVDQPILVGWHDGTLYLEANPSQTQANDIDFDNDMTIRPLTPGMKKEIIHTAGEHAKDINWELVDLIVKLRRGYPMPITGAKAATTLEQLKKEKAEPPKSSFGKPQQTGTIPENRKRQMQWSN